MKNLVLIIAVFFMAIGFIDASVGITSVFEIAFAPFWLFFIAALVAGIVYLVIDRMSELKNDANVALSNLAIKKRELSMVSDNFKNADKLLKEKVKYISQLKETITSKNGKLNTLSNELSRINQNISTIRYENIAKDEEIKKLKASIHSYKANFAKYAKKENKPSGKAKKENIGSAFKITWEDDECVWIVRAISVSGEVTSGVCIMNSIGIKTEKKHHSLAKIRDGFIKTKASKAETKLLYNAEKRNKE